MFEAFTAAQIRTAEAPLVDATDNLMKQAAHHVFRVAESMVQPGMRVLVMAGKGGNGGDALYAGAELALAGFAVDAWLVFGDAHSPALDAFRNAGGRVGAPEGTYGLAIDGVTGIGGTPRPLPPEIASVPAERILAVDVPSGIDADTGEAAEGHVTADATVTFGGWRLAHGLAPQCGVQLLAGIGDLGERLRGTGAAFISRASGPQGHWPEGIQQLGTLPHGSLEPGAHDDKYTGGVVGIRAGSGTYPGAAVLSVAGAMAATPAMVRYAGPQALEVVRAHPEVVAADAIADTGRVQAWVYGPGAGTGAEELAEPVAKPEPLLVDADGLTALAEHPDLRERLSKRDALTVLTPHDGEFARLRTAMGIGESDRLPETKTLAEQLGCVVLRKGRATIIAGEEVSVVDAGNSWAATPGSGDVLAGIAGARLARNPHERELTAAVQVHALAAKLSAQTRFGEAPTSASRIAEHVREATALLSGAPTS